MKKKEKKKREKHIAVKLFLCIIYSIIITILFVCSYHIYQVKNIVSGEPNDAKDNFEDVDISIENEYDEDDEPINEFDKINTIEFVKNILNDVGQNREMNNIIVESLGDKFKILNDIFNKEEERKLLKKK